MYVEPFEIAMGELQLPSRPYPPLTATDFDALARMGLPRTSLDLPKENTTVTERIDHATEARKHIEWTHEWQEREGETPETGIAIALIAQAEASLALVDQQRIANLITLGQVIAGDGSRPFWQLVMVPVNEFDVAPHPDIASVLGLDTNGVHSA